MINNLIGYLDLQSERRDFAKGQGASGSGESLSVWPQYLAAAAGVIADPFLRNYIASGSFNVTWHVLWLRVIFGLLIGLAILPAVYRASFDAGRPSLVQIATLFVSGLGWQSLFSAAVKAAGQ